MINKITCLKIMLFKTFVVLRFQSTPASFFWKTKTVNKIDFLKRHYQKKSIWKIGKAWSHAAAAAAAAAESASLPPLKSRQWCQHTLHGWVILWSAFGVSEIWPKISGKDPDRSPLPHVFPAVLCRAGWINLNLQANPTWKNEKVSTKKRLTGMLHACNMTIKTTDYIMILVL